jgi:dolichol-phosphate mannosyltransferase
MKLAIAIPTYNEATNVKKLLPAIHKSLADYPKLDCTVFIIDDNSPDGTADIAETVGKKLKTKAFHVEVIRRKRKEGLGKAYVFAFHKLLERKFDYILQMDADLSHNPKYLPHFLDATQTADFVVGSRYVKGGDTPDWSWNRKLLSRGGNLYTRLMLGSQITDYTGGFNLFSVGLLHAVNLNNLQDAGYGFLIELKYRALQNSHGVVQVPIVFMDRAHGESKLPNNIIIKNLMLVAQIRVRPNAK